MPSVRPELRVEGVDDIHALSHLLLLNGVDLNSNQLYPEIKETKGITKMLDTMELAVQVSTGRPIGFVLDADAPLCDRWSAVRQRLGTVGVITPDVPPVDGFIGQSNSYVTKVGVWLMPDNVQDGALEDFLTKLITDNDPLIDHAQISTGQAKFLGAAFPVSATGKAIIHTWLAWQEEPGLRYGTALRAQYFNHNHALVERFVAWFRLLYGV